MIAFRLSLIGFFAFATRTDVVQAILVRTKADLNLPFVETKSVMKWVNTFNAALVSTSAKQLVNVDKVFYMAARLAVAAKEVHLKHVRQLKSKK